MPDSERQLQNTQAGLAAMLEANQTALVSHMAALLIPIQEGQVEMRGLFNAMQDQIQQLQVHIDNLYGYQQRLEAVLQEREVRS